MKAVFDTNVLVSGMLSVSGPPGWIVEAVLSGDVQPVYNTAMLDEYAEVLQRIEFGIAPLRVQTLLQCVEADGWCVVSPLWRLELPDVDDGFFLAAAAAAQVPLVTGNTRHFPPKSRGGVTVLSPREFADLYSGTRR